MVVIPTMSRHDGWVELQQIRYVVAVAEELSFTRAAERCFVVQSALSHRIKALESELGVTLFARSSRRVALTPAGEAFLPAARASLAAAERAATDAAAAAGRVRGTLTIGVIPTVTALDLPAVLADFHRDHPAVRIRLQTGDSKVFMAAIGTGDVDIAVLGMPASDPPTGVAWRELSREDLVAVVPDDHRLAGRPRVGPAELADETFVDFPTGTPGRTQSDRAFRAAGLHRDVPFEVTSTDLILDLVRSGLAVALLAPGIVAAGDGLRTVPITDGPSRIQYVAWSDFNPSPAARAFLAAMPTRPPDRVHPIGES